MGPTRWCRPKFRSSCWPRSTSDDPESMLRYEKTVSLLYDMREQGARVLALANAGRCDDPVAGVAHHPD